MMLKNLNKIKEIISLMTGEKLNDRKFKFINNEIEISPDRNKFFKVIVE